MVCVEGLLCGGLSCLRRETLAAGSRTVKAEVSAAVGGPAWWESHLWLWGPACFNLEAVGLRDFGAGPGVGQGAPHPASSHAWHRLQEGGDARVQAARAQPAGTHRTSWLWTHRCGLSARGCRGEDMVSLDPLPLRKAPHLWRKHRTRRETTHAPVHWPEARLGLARPCPQAADPAPEQVRWQRRRLQARWPLMTKAPETPVV